MSLNNDYSFGAGEFFTVSHPVISNTEPIVASMPAIIVNVVDIVGILIQPNRSINPHAVQLKSMALNNCSKPACAFSDIVSDFLMVLKPISIRMYAMKQSIMSSHIGI